MKINKVVLIFFIICLACDRRNESEKRSIYDTTEIIVHDFLNAKGVLYSQLFDSIKFVKLETKPEALIGRIDKIIYYKSKYFILDQLQSKSVFVFSEEGKFIRKIGKTGKGPGEYDEPNDIAIDPSSDRILIYVNNSKCILSYNITGEFYEKIDLEYWIKSFSILDEKNLALYLDYTENANVSQNSQYNLLLINRKGKILNKEFKFEKGIDFGKGGFYFFNRTPNRLLVSPSYSNTIYEIGKDLVKPVYFIDFGKNTIPKEQFIGKSSREFNKEFRDSYYASLNRYFETPDHLIFSFASGRKIFNGYYSKNTGKLICSDLFFNDIYSLLAGGSIFDCYNDKIITSIEVSSINKIKQIYNSSLNDGNKLKIELIKYYESSLNEYNEIVNESIKKSIEFIKKVHFADPTIEEIQFINSINANDNPLLMIASLKDF